MGLLLVFSLIIPGVIFAQPWSEITEITPNDSGDDFNPRMAVYNGKLYVVWYTFDTNISTNEDSDIVIKCYDGVDWSDTVEVTMSNDTGNDFAPQICVFNEKLWFVWQTEDTISNVPDMDIVIRCYNSTIGDINDTNAWGEIIELTPKNDTDSDYNPQLCSYNNKLYVVWETTNNLITAGDDRDIVLRCYDSISWGELQEVTLKDDAYDDMYPNLCVFQGKLWVCWQTQNNSISEHIDDDILIRWHDSLLGTISDANAWGSVYEVNPSNDSTENYYVEDRCPIMNVFDDKLYVLWQRTEYPEDTLCDSDLVMSNNELWGEFIEIMPNDDADDGSKFKGGFDFTVYNNKLYIIWQSLSGGKYGVDWDIFVKSYDGEMFGHATELTSSSNIESDDFPSLAVYNGELYAAWQTRDNTTSSGGDGDIVIRCITIQAEVISGHEVEVAYGMVGTLNVDEAELPDNLPDGFTDIGIVINVTGSAENAQILIKYNDSDIPENYSEESIKMYYWNGTAWNKIDESGVDTGNNIVWANVSHFTIFAPVAAKISESTWNPWYLEPDVYSALILMASAIIVLVIVIEVLIYRMTLHKGKGKPPTQRKKNKT